MELDPGKLTLIGLLASVIAQIIKSICAWRNVRLEKNVVSAIVMVISVALAFVWLKPLINLPADPMEMAVYLINQAAAVLGFATLIYNILLVKLLRKLNLESDRFLPNLNFKVVG